MAKADPVEEDAQSSFEYSLIVSGFVAGKAVEVCIDNIGATSTGPLALLSLPRFWFAATLIPLILRFFHGNVALMRQVHGLPLLPLSQAGTASRIERVQARCARFLRFFAPYVLHPSQYVLFSLAAISVADDLKPTEGSIRCLSWLILIALFDVVISLIGLAVSRPPERGARDMPSQRRRLVQQALFTWAAINGLSALVLAVLRSRLISAPEMDLLHLWRWVWCTYAVAFLADYALNRELFFSRRAA